MISRVCNQCGVSHHRSRNPCKDCRNKQARHNYAQRSTDKQERKRVYARRWRYKQYGLTERDVALLLELQGGRCAVCGAIESRGGQALHVDHDHGTGRIRGMLCRGCNTALGHLQDNPSLLRRAADYLER